MLESLRSIGKSTDVYECPDGTRLWLLSYGARVLGLFAPGSDENFLWTHPQLADADSARAMYQSDGWHNSGGDRTWLTPEVDIFFPDYPRTEVHQPPVQLDASDYLLTRTGDGAGWVKRLSLTMARSKRKAELEMTKTVGPAVNPLRYEPEFQERLRQLQYAGYTLHTSLAWVGTESEEQDRVGLWNLMQLPHGGDILVPTYSRTEPRVLFGKIEPSDLVVDDQLVRFRIRAPGEHKIAIRAVATTGRSGYLYPTGGQWALVIRNFCVDPSGDYVDVPKDDLNDLGYSFHAVSIDSALGQFCEMEYHVPAIGGRTGRLRCDDTSQVWAFRGAREDILSVARLLLSPGIAH